MVTTVYYVTLSFLFFESERIVIVIIVSLLVGHTAVRVEGSSLGVENSTSIDHIDQSFLDMSKIGSLEQDMKCIYIVSLSILVSSRLAIFTSELLIDVVLTHFVC